MISGVSWNPNFLQLTPPSTGQSASTSSGGGFAQMLGDALNQANSLSSQADSLAASYAAGGPVSVDNLMVAEQKASLGLDMVVQVNNRVVSAYQSVMNMQV